MFQRAEQLLGTDAMKRIGAQRVIIFGVGGVGSWCAEALVRTGIQHLTLVDFDRVDVSNINRQLMATSQTVGQVKVDVLRERLLAINPNADITALPILFNEESAPSFRLEEPSRNQISGRLTHSSIFSHCEIASEYSPDS